MPTRSNTRLLVAGLMAAALAWIVVAQWQLGRRIFPEHDEIISFLAASGQQVAYAQAVGTHVDAPASSLQKLWSVTRPLPFSQIERDLAAADIHPPGYFFLLNRWLDSTQSSLGSALQLNLLLALLCAGLLAFAARRLWQAGPVEALALALVWLWMPATMDTALFARQYMLLTLELLLLVLLMAQYLRKPDWRLLAGIGLVQGCCLLTSYQSALVLGVANAAAMLLFLRARQVRPVAALIAAGTFALLSLWFLNPGFMEELGRQQVQAARHGSAVQQLVRLPSAFAQLVVYIDATTGKATGLLARVVSLSALGAIGFICIRKLRWREASAGSYFFIFCVAALPLSLHAILFALGFFPSHSMGARYLTIYTPLVILLAGYALHAWRQQAPAQARAASAGIVALLLVGVCSFTVSRNALHAREVEQQALLRAPVVVVDSVRRGVLPRFAWNAPAEPVTRIVAAVPAELPDRLKQLDASLQQTLAWAHSAMYPENTAIAAAQVDAALKERGYVGGSALRATDFELRAFARPLP